MRYDPDVAPRVARKSSVTGWMHIAGPDALSDRKSRRSRDVTIYRGAACQGGSNAVGGENAFDRFARSQRLPCSNLVCANKAALDHHAFKCGDPDLVV